MQLDGFGDLKIGMIRCSKIAFESGSVASADAQKNGNAMCASCLRNNVNLNRRQLMSKRKHECRELAIPFCCSCIDKGAGPIALAGKPFPIYEMSSSLRPCAFS